MTTQSVSRPLSLPNNRYQTRIDAITRSEWSRVLVVILLVLLVTSLPYWYGYATAPADKVYMGIMLDAPDHLQYFSWMRELSQANLAANKLTPEANAPVFFNLLWWGLGHFSNALHWDYAQTFQLLRVVATTLFLLLLYRVCAWFLPRGPMRWTAFLLATLTSGLGWLLIVLKYTVAHGQLYFPLDLYVAEGNTFLSMLGYPHFIAALLYIFVFDLVLRGQQKHDWRYDLAAGLFAFFLGWQHAYDLIIVYAVLAAYTLLTWLRDRAIPWHLVRSGLMIGVISCWPALYSVLLTSLDPIWKEVLAQFSNAGVYTPGLLHLPILLGIPFVLALLTAIADNPFKLKGKDNNTLFIMGWFWISFVLIYLPVDYQIHMLNGWQVPIAILATQGVFRYGVPRLRSWQQRRQQERLQQRRAAWSAEKWLPVLLILLVLPTNLYLFSWRFLDLARHDYPYYLHKDEIGGLNWLEGHVKPDDVVLSSLTLGQYIPAHTGAHAFLAHWAQTVDFFEKERLVNLLYAPGTEVAQAKAILTQYHVRYIVCGPAERELGSCDTAAKTGNTVYQTPQLQIIEVAH
jgi:hypothetical protein